MPYGIFLEKLHQKIHKIFLKPKLSSSIFFDTFLSILQILGAILRQFSILKDAFLWNDFWLTLVFVVSFSFSPPFLYFLPIGLWIPGFSEHSLGWIYILLLLLFFTQRGHGYHFLFYKLADRGHGYLLLIFFPLAHRGLLILMCTPLSLTFWPIGQWIPASFFVFLPIGPWLPALIFFPCPSGPRIPALIFSLPIGATYLLRFFVLYHPSGLYMVGKVLGLWFLVLSGMSTKFCC